MHSRTLALVAILFAACFQSADGRVPIRCDADNPCPDGQVCRIGLCAFEEAPDLAISDMATVASVGCAASNGVKIGNLIWGCPGVFGLGQARSLCAKGWTVCKSLSAADRTACEAQISLFIADIPAHRPSTALVCSPTTIYQRLFAACASTMSLGMTEACGGFYRFAIDQTAGFDFSNGHSLDKAIGNTPTNGVLCCQ